MKPPILVQGTSHPGAVRERNEDAYAIVPDAEHGLLLLVCDGMGGMGRGDEASKMAVESIANTVRENQAPPGERLGNAIRVADSQVREALCTGHQGRAGSTAVMVYLDGEAAHVAWVGDSRAYLLRDGAVTARTRDHKLVQELVDAGELTPEQARNSPMANVVTRALGGRKPTAKAVEPEVMHLPWQLQPGDRLMLCSDGVSDLVEDGELWELIGTNSPTEGTEAIVETAMDRGGHDNITVIIAHWEGAEDDVDFSELMPRFGGSAALTDEEPVSESATEVMTQTPMPAPTPDASPPPGSKDTAVLAPLSDAERAELKRQHRGEAPQADTPTAVAQHTAQASSDPGSPGLAIASAVAVIIGAAVFAGALAL